MNWNSFHKGMLLVALCAGAASGAAAAGFAAGISPSRFELAADPGDTLRDTLTIVNPTDTGADYLFRTTDWRLDERSSVEFIEDSLLEGSCRPWVRLERRTVRLQGGDQKNYRFEIHVPEDAEPGLCTFAILIEPAEAFSANAANGAVSVPVVGRYAVITYVTIGAAAADIRYMGLSVENSNGQRLPTVTLRNEGTTLDRTFGQITATDTGGRRVSLVPSAFPILPGRTELIGLLPEAAGADRVSGEGPLRYPLQLRGQIEIGDQVIRIDETVE